MLHADAPCLKQLVQLVSRLQKLAGDPAPTPQLDTASSELALLARVEELVEAVERSALWLELGHFEQLVGRLERLGGGDASNTSGAVLAPVTPSQTHLTYDHFMVTGADPKLYSQVGKLEGLVSRLDALPA